MPEYHYQINQATPQPGPLPQYDLASPPQNTASKILVNTTIQLLAATPCTPFTARVPRTWHDGGTWVYTIATSALHHVWCQLQ